MPKGLTFLSSVALSAALLLPVTGQAEPHADTVVATVNGEDITLGHLIVARQSLPEQYRQLPAETLYDAMLEQLIQQVALKQSLTRKPPQYVEISLENERRSQLAALVLEDTMQAVSDDEIRAAYDAQYGSGQGGQEYDASHILVETKEAADEIKKELDAGADFAQMAKDKSTGPSGPGGGALGWFGEGRMVPEFEAAVKELETGQISEPVQTQFGWHVIRLNDQRTAQAPEFDAVKEEIAGTLRTEAVEERIVELVEAADVVRPEVDGLTPQAIENVDLVRN